MSSPTLQTNYAGDVLDYIVTETVTGNEAYEKGSIYMIPDVPDKISIGKMTSSTNPIIRREAMPTTKSATVAKTEFQLTPQDMMIFINDINPRTFEHDWRPFQPKGALPDKVLDPRIQKIFADVVLKQAQNQLGRLFWQGDTTLPATNPLSFFNGYITRGVASSTNIDVTNIGVITVNNVQAVLNDCEESVPDALFEDPDMTYHMSTATFRMYQQSVVNLTYKGQGPAEKVPAIGPNGREIRFYSGFPANTILVARGTSGQDSHLYAATEKVQDAENFKIERLRPEGEHFFLLAKFKFDANYSLDSETVLYRGS
jgi:hypothetical protein